MIMRLSLAGTEAGVGYHLSKYLTLEARANYRRYAAIDKLPIATKELNNLRTALALVGAFNLTKQRQ